MIRLRYGIKGRSDPRATSARKLPGTHASTTGHPFAAVVNTQRLSANTATAAGSRVQPQALPADSSTAPRKTSPAGDATYAITGLTTATGQATLTHVTMVNLSGSPQAVVSATNVNGNTTVTWDPTIQVAVPAGAVAGTYSATITHSVA